MNTMQNISKKDLHGTSKGKKHRIIAMVLIPVLIALAVLPQLKYALPVRADEAFSGQTAETLDTIERFRREREETRARQRAQLNEIAHDAETDIELVAMAKWDLLSLCRREEEETTIEGLMRMRGWQDVAVSVHNGSVNVMLRTASLTQSESAIIYDIVCDETGITGGNVKIIPIN